MSIPASVVANLILKAEEMTNFSYSPYSNFRVGAALLTKDEEIFTGCNIENAAYGATMCAERTAFFKAISNGKKAFSAIAIVGGKNGVIEDYCPPCGTCLQVMMEFCDPEEFTIILTNKTTGSEDFHIKMYKLKDLLPLGFASKTLIK